MKHAKSMIFILLLSLGSSFSSANILIYNFDDPVKEQRFNFLINELRCPKCQNNNLADSNSGLAVDLKNIIYEKIIAGESNDAIVDYLKARYGDFISYRPPVKPSTWMIWFGPFGLLLLGIFVIYKIVNKQKILTSKQQKISQKNQQILTEWSQEMDANKSKDKVSTKPVKRQDKGQKS